MQQIDVQSGDPGFPATLQKFQAMPLADQLPLLAFALQQDLDRNTWVPPSPGSRRPGNPRVQRPVPSVSPVPLVSSAGTVMPVRPVPLVPPVRQTEPPQAAARNPTIIESDFVDMRVTVEGAEGARAPRATFLPVERDGNASIVMTICASFTLIIATMIWQHHAATNSRQEPGFMPQRPALATTVSRVAAAPAPPPAAPPVKPNAIAPHDSTDRMPVTVYFHRRGVHDDPSDRRKVDWLMEGRLTNLSDQPLGVEVRVESANAQGASLAQIGVDPHGQRDFGADDGLRIHAGDKVTLVSAPYEDVIAAGAN
jgi:hypothetical protein